MPTGLHERLKDKVELTKNKKDVETYPVARSTTEALGLPNSSKQTTKTPRRYERISLIVYVYSHDIRYTQIHAMLDQNCLKKTIPLKAMAVPHKSYPWASSLHYSLTNLRVS